MSTLLEVSAAKIQMTDNNEFELDTYSDSDYSNDSKKQLPKLHSSHQKNNQRRNEQHIKKQFLKRGIYFV